MDQWESIMGHGRRTNIFGKFCEAPFFSITKLWESHGRICHSSRLHSSNLKKFALNSLAEYKKVSQAARGLTDRGQWVKDELARNALRAPPSKFEISFVRRSIFKAHAFC